MVTVDSGDAELCRQPDPAECRAARRSRCQRSHPRVGGRQSMVHTLAGPAHRALADISASPPRVYARAACHSRRGAMTKRALSAPRASALLGDTQFRDYSSKLRLFNAFAEPELRRTIG